MRSGAAHGGSIRAIAQPSKRGAGLVHRMKRHARGEPRSDRAWRTARRLSAPAWHLRAWRLRAGRRWRMAGTAAACRRPAWRVAPVALVLRVPRGGSGGSNGIGTGGGGGGAAGGGSGVLSRPDALLAGPYALSRRPVVSRLLLQGGSGRAKVHREIWRRAVLS